MSRTLILVLSGALGAASLLGAVPAAAQASPPAVPVPPPTVPAPATASEFPQLTLSASAFREVAQDRVAVTLYASHEAPEPAPAQAQVNSVLSPVLERLKQRKDLEVQSAGYRTDPVWQDSRIVAWRARAALRVTAPPSGDFDKLIGELASQLSVESVVHFLSRDAQLAVEQELIGEAVGAFRSKAQAAAQALGFKGWSIRSVSVNDSGPGNPEPMPKMMMSRATAADAAPMPLAEGRTTVSVSVGGTVVLER
ncbi:MAG: SIMPL domain-containing protein [Gammaproteobacteria bacterium]